MAKILLNGLGSYISRSSGANVATAPRDRGGSIAHGDYGYTGSYNPAVGGPNYGAGGGYGGWGGWGGGSPRRGRGYRTWGRGFDGRGFDSSRGVPYFRPWASWNPFGADPWLNGYNPPAAGAKGMGDYLDRVGFWFNPIAGRWQRIAPLPVLPFRVRWGWGPWGGRLFERQPEFRFTEFRRR